MDQAGNPVGPLDKASSDRAVFDVTVSLYRNPSGDDDPDNDTGSEEQTAYENVIRRWADAVCEQSNGGHKLGKVRIFRDGAFSSRSDVVWNEKEWPRANVSGFGTAGLRIVFGDIFPNGRGAGLDKDMLADVEGAGYTLGHEWGHYVYGLYDEYEGSKADAAFNFPRLGDTPPEPAIMNSQWKARGGNFEWLNHSTEDNFEADTAQGRAYGASCWEVLARPTKDDPKDGNRKGLPERTHYTNLDSRQPTEDDDWMLIELPDAEDDCRDQLEIIWMTEDLGLQLVIDRSGSMNGTPISNARTAGKNLVDVVPDGQTAMGLVSFNQTATQNFAVTAIPDPGTAVKDSLKNAIDTLAADGLTAMFDAASLALTNLLTFQNASAENANLVVFLLSDGLDNSSSSDQAAVTAQYQSADVPLVTFGYGMFAPDGVLRQLADDTEGAFFASPTTLAEIQEAFLAAVTQVSSPLTVADVESTVPGASSRATVDSFAVDSTIESLGVFLTHDGDPGALQLFLLDSRGALVSGPFSCTGGPGSSSCNLLVDEHALAAAGTGTWTLTASNGALTDVEVRGAVIAIPAAGRPYDLTVAVEGGSTVVFPEPIVVTATVSQGFPITGIDVHATVTDPTGTVQPVRMNDEGQEGDGIAGDGIYTAILGYKSDGLHLLEIGVDNVGGTARFADAGLQPAYPSPDVDGTEPLPPEFPPIVENFQRFTRVQVTVEGIAGSGGDDHPDVPPGTPIPADNSDVAGRIDATGDLDYFRIEGIPTDRPLKVRVANLALGMDPVLSLFRPDGVTLLASGDLNSTASSKGYVVLTVAPVDLDPSGTLVARVAHADADAASGHYEISAGPAVVSDQPAGGTCVASPTVLCLRQNRFAVEATWEDFVGNTGNGRARPWTQDTGSFWFFGPANVEIVLKLLDGRAINGHFWVFYAALSNVMYTITVTDTVTGSTATYANPTGRFASVGDTRALPGVSSGVSSHRSQVVEAASGDGLQAFTEARTELAGQPCIPADTTLCLGGDRFQVKVEWLDFQDRSGTGRAVPLSAASGYFWFFDSDNVELVIKVLNGSELNDHYWVFFGALTNVRYTITVTDTSTGTARTYVNPLGGFASVGDTAAFPDI